MYLFSIGNIFCFEIFGIAIYIDNFIESLMKYLKLLKFISILLVFDQKIVMPGFDS